MPRKPTKRVLLPQPDEPEKIDDSDQPYPEPNLVQEIKDDLTRMTEAYDAELLKGGYLTTSLMEDLAEQYSKETDRQIIFGTQPSQNVKMPVIADTGQFCVCGHPSDSHLNDQRLTPMVHGRILCFGGAVMTQGNLINMIAVTCDCTGFRPPVTKPIRHVKL